MAAEIQATKILELFKNKRVEISVPIEKMHLQVGAYETSLNPLLTDLEELKKKWAVWLVKDYVE